MHPKTYTDWRAWLRGIWTSAIKGGTGAVIASGGLLGGNLAGADVQPLSLKQIGVVFVGGVIVHLVIYLNQNAAPAEVPEDTISNQ